MPETFCADWDRVRLCCRVIGSFLPGLVTVSVAPQDIPCDENLVHWDPVAFLVINGLQGREINLRSTFVPQDLRFPNSMFWLCVHNDESWAIYGKVDSEQPLSRGSRAQAGM